MRKIFLIALAISFAGNIFWGCKKNQTQITPAIHNKNLEKEQLINNAKIFFESQVQSLKSLGNPLDKNNFNPVANLEKQPDWAKAYTARISVGNVVVVPIHFNQALTARPDYTSEGTHLPINEISKLIIYGDAAGKLKAEVVSSFPDQKFLMERKYFTGVAHIQDWQGNFVKGYKYSNGQVLSLVPNKSAGAPGGKKIIAPDRATTVTICDYIEWYTCVGTVADPYQYCTYQYTQTVGCTTYDISSGGSGGASSTDYGFISSGGGGGSTATSTLSSVQDITNNLTNPCFSSVLSTLQTDGLKNEITQILKNTFGANDQMNLTFIEATSTSNGSSGQTNATKNGSGTNLFWNVNITLSETKMKAASKEYIAETIFHEIIHAYLDVNGVVKGELPQHLDMIQSYMACEAGALMEVFPTLNQHDAYCLIVAGFSDVQQYDATTFNSILANCNLTLNDVVNTNNSYESGSKGTNCGTVSAPQ